MNRILIMSLSEADNRRKKILWAIVREFVDTAEPVGSATIVLKYDFGVSPATVRNDMVWLEEQGLLAQPHTSAGRIPTEVGYRYFVSEFVQPSVSPPPPVSISGAGPVAQSTPPGARGYPARRAGSPLGATRSVDSDLSVMPDAVSEQRRQLVEMHRAVSDDDSDRGARQFAQSLSDLTRGTVFLSLDDGRMHLAGMSYLFSQPEFRDAALLQVVTRALDRLDQILSELEGKLSRDVDVLIGEENPFGRGTSTIVLKYRTPQMGEGIIGLLGPQRMDYQTNYSLMRSLREVLIRP